MERVSEKENSKRILGAKEVLALHKILKGVIEKGVGEVERRYQRVAEMAERLERLETVRQADTIRPSIIPATPATATAMSSSRSTGQLCAPPLPPVEKIKELLYPLAHTQAGEISWSDHIKPLAETIKRSLRKTGDKSGLYEVVMWEKGVKERLSEIRVVRARIRKLTGLVSEEEDGEF
jgi:hypothetical protein